MKRKLVYDEPVGKNEECGADTPCEEQRTGIDFDPVHFLRCHSKINDAADVQTQVWQCAFEPDNSKLVATCGGNSVCFINVENGNVEGKYYSEFRGDCFYALCWTTMSDLRNEENILAVAGNSPYIHLLHPKQSVVFFKYKSRTGKKKKNQDISSLLFHPHEKNILFCSQSNGDMIVFDVGCPLPPRYKTKFDKLNVLSAKSEIFSLAFSSEMNILLAACNGGLRGWKCAELEEMEKAKFLVFEHPPLEGQNTSHGGDQLVDSVEVLNKGIVATKCALHGCIYVWSLKEALENVTKKNTLKVVPSYVLKWQDSDNYFMNMGFSGDLLVSGDDKGSLWIYNTLSFLESEIDRKKEKNVKPTLVLPWPEVVDIHLERKRKLRLDIYDIVLDKVAVNSTGQFIVAVTNNNMVCVWKKKG